MKSKTEFFVDLAVGVVIAFLLGMVAGRFIYAATNDTKTTDTTELYVVQTDEKGRLTAVPQTYTVPIVYEDDDEEPATYNRVYYPLTQDEREWIAEILAGKAVDRTEACQRMVATVIYNEITACGGDIEQAVETYGLTDTRTPTAQIYKVVDAVFYDGELMLDPEVLYFNDADHHSAFHDSLVYVDECDGIVFYKEHRPNVIPD